jgi:hypothetical protein
MRYKLLDPSGLDDLVGADSTTAQTRVQTLHFLCGPGGITIGAAHVLYRQRNEA